MENGISMLIHSIIIGVILYFFMRYILGQNKVLAENRSILLASLILIYMILFGHGLPYKINKNIF
jgi:TRAP-type C4-dicarboxylate transport system permease small subunit